MSTNRILVALDTSQTADGVLEHAIDLARSSNGKIRLFRAVGSTVDPLLASGFDLADTNARIAEAESDLLRLETRVPAEQRDGVMVVVGNPAEAICTFARSYVADTVVMGAHRYGVFDRVLGTTSANVVNHIDRPVFIVRPIAPPITRRTGSAITFSAMSLMATRLRKEHAHLERLYADLLEAYRSESWDAVRQQWTKLDSALRLHMDLEEREVFNAFRLGAPTEADALSNEHTALRELLSTLSVAIDLHAVPERDVVELIDRLRAHEKREEQVFFPWLDQESQTATAAAAATNLDAPSKVRIPPCPKTIFS